MVTHFVIETSLKTSVYIPKTLQTAGEQQERSIIKRVTRILSYDGGLKGTFLTLKYPNDEKP